MPTDRVTRELNVEVERHSDTKYGEGMEQGVKFTGIDGYWKVSQKADIYNAKWVREGWPPVEGKVFLVELAAKPVVGRADCYYRDIWDIKKATGEPETWDWQADLGVQPAGAPASSGGGGAPWGGDAGKAAGGQAASTVDGRNRSIERHVVLKAMAEVLAAALANEDCREDAKRWLMPEFEARCNELWAGEQKPAAAAEEPEEQAGRPAGDGGPEELDDDDLPF